MRIHNLLLAACIGALLALASCRSTTAVPGQMLYHNFDTFCLEDTYDGVVTLRVWGTGANKAQAIEQAKKRALHEVLFTGVKAGRSSAAASPLLLEVNAQEKFQYYFDRFFANNGEFQSFVLLDDANINSRTKAETKARNGYSVVVRVFRAQLRQRLINDGIIKP